MRLPRPLIVATLAVALVSCGTTVTKEQADFACTNLGVAVENGAGIIDPVSFTHEQLQEKYGLSPPDAAEVLRQAVRDYCPQYQRML